MNRFHLALLSAAAIFFGGSTSAHAQNIASFICNGGVNQVSFPADSFNVSTSTSVDSSSGSAVKTTVNSVTLTTDLSQYPELQPFAAKASVLRSCVISGTLPSGLIISYSFASVTVGSVNAIASEPVETTQSVTETTQMVGTFTGLTIQVYNPPSPK